jgi:hypothetical protein
MKKIREISKKIGFPLFAMIVVYIIISLGYLILSTPDPWWLLLIIPIILSIPVLIISYLFSKFRYRGLWKIGLVSFIIILIFFLFAEAYNRRSYQTFYQDLSGKRHKIEYFQYLRMEEDIEKYGHADAFFDGKEIKVYEGDIYEGQKNIFEKILKIDEERLLLGFTIIILYLLIPLVLLKLFNMLSD